MRSPLLIAALLLLAFSVSPAQMPWRSDLRSLVMKGNAVSSIVYNTGSISGPGVLPNVHDLVWHGLGYAYELAPMVGARVAVSPADSVTIVSEGFGASNGSTADGDFSPDGTTKWGFLPVPGYSDSGQTEIANNQNQMSWPSSWSSWPGTLAPPTADLEAVYGMDDGSDAEFPYYPFTGDSTRRGLGLEVAVHYYLLAHPALEDMMLTTYDIRNVSDRDLPKVVAGMYGDPHIGGASDFGDDAANMDSARHLIYSWDPDGKGTIPALTPGYFGTLFAGTPGGLGMTSFSNIVYGGYNRPKNDTLMYQCMTPGTYTPWSLYPPGELNDYVMIGGTGYFALPKDSSAALAIAYLFAPDLAGLKERADHCALFYDALIAPRGPAVTVTAPVPGTVVTANSIAVQWNTAAMNGDSTVSLFYMDSYGESWGTEIARNVPNTGSYTWNLGALPDGVFYKVAVVNRNGAAASMDTTDGMFTINRAGDSAPQAALLTPVTERYAGTLPVTWVAGDPEGDPVTVNVFYSDAGAPFSEIGSGGNNGLFLFDTRTVANTPSGRVRLDVTANGKTVSVTSPPFRIANPFFAMTDTASMKHAAGRGTGRVFPGIADSAALTGHLYRVSFDSVGAELRYILTDLTAGAVRIAQAPMTFITGSGTKADGMRLWFVNDVLGLDSLRSGFAAAVPSVRAVVKKPAVGTFKPAPVDVLITFGSFDTTATGEYAFPMDSAGSNNPSVKNVRLPFKVTVSGDTAAPLLVVRDMSLTGKTGRWDFGEELVVLTPLKYRTASNNAHTGVIFSRVTGASPPVPPGSVYTVRSTRPFTEEDVFEFTAASQYGEPTGVRPAAVPSEFVLYQNYPNPFNPVTTVRYALPMTGRVTLTVYSILGQEVARYDDGVRPAGYHERTLSAASLSSGLYLYRLQVEPTGVNATPFTAVKKMLVVK